MNKKLESLWQLKIQIKIKPRKAQWGCPRPALLHLQGRARGDGSAKVRRMVMFFHDKDVHGVMFFIMVMTRNFLLDNDNDGICCQICLLYQNGMTAVREGLN